MARTPQGKTRTGVAMAKPAWVCLGVVLTSPLLVFIAVTGLKLGVWDRTFAYDVLTMRGGAALAGLGVAAALAAVVVGFRAPRQAGLPAVLAVVAAAVTAGLFWPAIQLHAAPAVVADVTSNADEPPGFSSAILARRRADGAAPVPTGVVRGDCVVQAAPTQVAPGVAAYALQQAGFQVPGAGVGRADGSRAGMWFGFGHDAIVRIRPGRTDVRVTARQARADGGLTCRLATRIAAELQPRS